MKNWFPYKYRPYQGELIHFLKNSIDKGARICIEAPTGFGKTPVVLAGLLPIIMREGLRIIWVTRTGNEADRPIEELKVISQKKNANIFGLSFRGKRDMCLFLRERGEIQNVSYRGASIICKFLRQHKKCPYYTRFKDYDIADLSLGEPLLYSEILEFCNANEICPYYLQYELLPRSKVIALSYNYVLSEDISWSIRRKINFSNTILVVDEAHNLQRVIMNINSDSISISTVDLALKEAIRVGAPIDTLRSIRKRLEDLENNMVINNELEVSIDHEEIFREEEYEEYKLFVKIGEEIYKMQIKMGKSPRSSLHKLGEFALSVLEKISERGVVLIATREPSGFKVELWDMRAAEVLQRVWDKFFSVVFISGTLTPIEGFAETIGVSNPLSFVVPSRACYNFGNIASIFLKGVSTRGETLSEEECEKYRKLILEFSNLPMNIAVFSASYRIQNEIITSKEFLRALESHREVFIEKQGMPGDEARKILNSFKKCYREGKKGLLFATATGRFAEGADFPGSELEAIFLVGVPFEQPSLKTNLYIHYYREVYGEKKGYYYAYIIPAFRRAAQALGRALRSSKDRAIFVCGDERYMEKRYFNLLPEYVRATIIRANWNRFQKALQKALKKIGYRNYTL